MSCTITVCILSGFLLLQKICTKMWHVRRYYYTEQRELCLLGDGLPLHILSCVLPEKQAHAGVCIIVMCFTHQHNCVCAHPPNLVHTGTCVCVRVSMSTPVLGHLCM